MRVTPPRGIVGMLVECDQEGAADNERMHARCPGWRERRICGCPCHRWNDPEPGVVEARVVSVE